MKKIIIGIHGLGNKPPEDLLNEWWIRSIEEGLLKIGKFHKRIPFRLVYWADIVYEKPLDPAEPNKKSPYFLRERYLKSLNKPAPDFKGFRLKMLQYLENRLDKIFLNEDMTINFSGVTDRFIHHFFEDLEKYYIEDYQSPKNPELTIRDAIRNRLSEILQKYRRYEVFLIAHSMGSIIAYDVLASMKNGKIKTLATIGSPLGIPVIVSRIHKEQQQRLNRDITLTVPEVITGKWLNMSDIRDQVALDHTLNDDFRPNTKNIPAEDISVYNDYEIDEDPNPHKSYGYLRTPQLAQALDEFLSYNIGTIIVNFFRNRIKKKYNAGNKPGKIFIDTGEE